MNLPLPHDPAEFIGTIPVSLAVIKPSPTNPRENFPADKMAELVESVRLHGVLQPILLRPWPEDYPHPEPRPEYEIVAGERRFRAAKAAGLANIEAKVRKLSDTEVLEIQIIENLQRADLHPMEEAIGYERMLESYGYTAESLADKIGKSKAYVYARVKLTALCHEARKAFYAGKLNPSTALLIARIPITALQEKATREITDPDWRGEVMSVRNAQKHLQHKYMLRLTEAPFPVNDPDLIKKAGSCEHCPKRTGNQPADLFDDVKSADVCTDPECFAEKRQAHTQRVASAAQASGKTVITGDKAEKIMPYGSPYNIKQGLVSLDTTCFDDEKRRTYREIIDEQTVGEITLIENTRTGTFVEAVPENQLAEALKAAGIVQTKKAKDEYAAKNEKAQEERAFRKALYENIRPRVADDMEKSGLGLTRQELAIVAKAMLLNLNFVARETIVLSHLPNQEKASAEDVANFINSLATHRAAIDISLVLLDCAMYDETMPNAYSYEKTPEDLLQLAKDYQVSPEMIRIALAAKQEKSPPPPKKAAQAAGVVAPKTTPDVNEAAPAADEARPAKAKAKPKAKSEDSAPASRGERKGVKTKKVTNEKAVMA